MGIDSKPGNISQIRSMTGFAQAVVHENGFVLRVNVRSVNHKSLDVHVSLPDQLQALEPAVRKEIAIRSPRGHVQFKAALEQDGNRGPRLDEALIDRYIELFRRVGERHGIPLETTIATFSQLPGVVSTSDSVSAPSDAQALERAFLKAVAEAVASWDAARASEGNVLEQDLRSRAVRLAAAVQRTEVLRIELLPAAQEKLRERLNRSLLQAGVDSARVAQEAAILAEHSDVTEELLRLKAHLAQFIEVLGGGSEVGKKLDFLLQEVLREVNTLLAKTAGLGEIGLPMTQAALDIKGEVEKLREQVQNVQ
jgi:uncharacterized protein (TIGR00255 family)